MKSQSVRAQADEAPAHVPVIVTGALAGGAPHIKVLTLNPVALTRSFYAFPENFKGGVNVSLGDIDGDGYQDIIAAAGPGGAPHVKVFSGLDNSVLASFYAYGESFRGGINIASCDVNNDGKADLITGAGAGGAPHVKVFSGANFNDVLGSFYAYGESFKGGVRVASADLDGDGKAELVTGAGAGGAPHVRFFELDGSGVAGTPVNGFYAYGQSFSGGVNVNANVDANKKAIVITGAGPGQGQHVRLFNPDGTQVAEIIPAGSGTQGANVAIGNIDADAADEYAIANASQSSNFRVYEQPTSAVGSTTAAYPNFGNGISIAMGVI